MKEGGEMSVLSFIFRRYFFVPSLKQMIMATGIVSPTAGAIHSTFCRCLLPTRRLVTLKQASFFSLSRSSSLPLKRSPQRLRIRAARTESEGVSLGLRAPDFELPEPLTGKVWKLDDFEPYPALLVMFICNHCPFVKHLKNSIVKLSNFYMKKGLAVVAISSNSVVTHPQDGPEYMAEEAKLFKYPFPYLYDELLPIKKLKKNSQKSVFALLKYFLSGHDLMQSQDVAQAFGAVCTPEFFLFKKDGRRPFELFYHGQFDDSRPSNSVPATGRDLSLAIDAVLSGQPLTSMQKPSVGCSIKWHPEKNY